jgi:uridine kinase
MARKELDIDLINKKSKANLSSLILKSEKYYSDQIKEIVEEITRPKSKIKILLIAGPSSAGKTTTSNLIRLELSMKNISSIVISLDDFYIDRINTPKLPDGSYDFENINTIDLKYLNNFVDKLLKTHKAKMPKFNFLNGKREEDFSDVVIDDHTIIMFEGLHALNPNLINGHKHELYKIYLSLNANYVKDDKLLVTAKEVRLIRRITRDFYTRGYSALETITSWPNVCAGEDKWVKPFKTTADYIIDSVHPYEILLYSKYTKPILKKLILNKNVKTLLKDVKDLDKKEALLSKLQIAKNLYNKLSLVQPITKENIPSTSLLWEFVGSAKNTVEPSGKIFD